MKIDRVLGFWELALYGLVSILALSIDVATLIVCTETFGLHYLLSAALAFLLGVSVAYVLSVTWAFKVRARTNRRQEFLIFAGIGIAGLGLNEFVMWNGTELLGLHYLVSKMLSAMLVFFFNFGLRKMLLFSDGGQVEMVRR